MSKNKVKVLYVDDEEGNLVAFRSTFRREMEVRTALSAQEGLEILEKEHIPVVISDQRMPGMTGVEFLAEVKRRSPHTMRMLLTGYADIQAVIDAVNEGNIYAYATKPWDENDLRLRISQAYEVHQLRGEREELFSRYEQVFSASGDPIVIVDDKGRFLEVNPAAERLFSMDRTTILGTPLTDLLLDPEALGRSLSGKRKGRSFRNVDLTIKSPNGDLMDCLLTITLLDESGKGNRQYQVIIKDITDRKQEEKRLRKLNSDLDRRVALRTKQLLEAMEDLGSFSYTVAHDLRSPLKNILALSEMLTSTSELVERDTLAEKIHKGADRMLDLVDDLLRFSQTSDRELKRRELDLALILDEVVQEMAIDSQHVELQNHVPAGTTLFADGAMLKVVLVNLLSNAIKFTRNTASPTIEIGSVSEEGSVHIWVKDNGVGFDAKGNTVVFNAFKRMHRLDQFEGSGVGLAIVQRIVAKHGGETWAEGKPGEGATIHMRIPNQALIARPLPFAS